MTGDPVGEPDSVTEAFAGPIFRVEVQRWGNRRRDVVRHRGAVAMLPFTTDGRVVLVRQLREAIRERLLEVPAGILDVPGETPPEAARRELEEETGMRVVRLEPLHPIHTSPGFVDETIHLFTAVVEETGERPTEEGVEVVVLPHERAMAMVRSGEISDAKTALLLLLVDPPVSAANGEGSPPGVDAGPGPEARPAGR